MNVKDFLNQVAYIKEIDFNQGGRTDPAFISDCYLSKFDGSYITHVGMEDNIKYIADHDITEQLTHGVGFSPTENKWYGWSHRAIFGFEIGSTCKKGDCHYIGSTLKEQEDAAVSFWEESYRDNVRITGVIEEDGNKFFDIEWINNDTIPNKKLKDQIGGVTHFITPLGKGEWVAETMEDAKQMAQDFNRGVS